MNWKGLIYINFTIGLSSHRGMLPGVPVWVDWLLLAWFNSPLHVSCFWGEDVWGGSSTLVRSFVLVENSDVLLSACWVLIIYLSRAETSTVRAGTGQGVWGVLDTMLLQRCGTFMVVFVSLSISSSLALFLPPLSMWCAGFLAGGKCQC